MGDEWPIEDVFDEDYLRFSTSRLSDEASDRCSRQASVPSMGSQATERR